MNLLQFKEHISSFPEGTIFNYGISTPFSWRGSYDEMAFAIEDGPMLRETILKRIEVAYQDTFTGWKGGNFNYEDWTPIHFEESNASYSAGVYVADKIALISDDEKYISHEDRLVKLAFRTKD